MISEAVKIVVVLSTGQKFKRIETIVSDGSYIEVNRAVSHIVGRDFLCYPVESFHWSYV